MTQLRQAFAGAVPKLRPAHVNECNMQMSTVYTSELKRAGERGLVRGSSYLCWLMRHRKISFDECHKFFLLRREVPRRITVNRLSRRGKKFVVMVHCQEECAK